MSAERWLCWGQPGAPADAAAGGGAGGTAGPPGTGTRVPEQDGQ